MQHAIKQSTPQQPALILRDKTPSVVQVDQKEADQSSGGILGGSDHSKPHYHTQNVKQTLFQSEDKNEEK